MKELKSFISIFVAICIIIYGCTSPDREKEIRHKIGFYHISSNGDCFLDSILTSNSPLTIPDSFSVLTAINSPNPDTATSNKPSYLVVVSAIDDVFHNTLYGTAFYSGGLPSQKYIINDIWKSWAYKERMRKDNLCIVNIVRLSDYEAKEFKGCIKMDITSISDKEFCE